METIKNLNKGDYLFINSTINFMMLGKDQDGRLFVRFADGDHRVYTNEDMVAALYDNRKRS